MNRENTRLLNAVLTTIIACLVVFTIATSIFGTQGFWSSTAVDKTPIPSTPAPIQIPVVVNNTGMIDTPLESTGVVTNTGLSNCTLDYTPVCGDNGQTYSNTCTAQVANIAIAYDGECKKIVINPPEPENTGSTTVAVVPKKDDTACTMEYAPVCGTDNKTYSNACVAGDVSIDHIGECDGTEKKVYSTGSYTLYSNTSIGYGFAMPKYSYYSSAGSRDGASHTMGIDITASGITDFSTASVQVWYYRTTPANPPSDQSMKTENGIVYIKNNDTTGNAKISTIIKTVIESVK